MVSALKKVWCGKINYPTRAEAERACRAIQDRTTQTGAKTYFCKTCDAYHFGHLRDNAPKRNLVPLKPDSEELMLTTIEKGKTVAPAKVHTAAMALAQADRELSWLSQRIAKGRSAPFSEITTITPEIAAHLLEQNTGNRPIRKVLVDRIVNDIKGGRWELNGEAIIVAKTGELNDGQHRLSAIIEAKKPVITNIIFGVDRGTRFTVDMGTTRTVGDFLGMEGAKYQTWAAAVARALICFRLEIYGKGHSEGITSTQVRAEYWKHDKEIQNACKEICGDKFLQTYGGAPLATATVLIARANREQAAFFIAKLASGDSLKRGDAILALRGRLTELRNTKARLGAWEKIELVLRYWNAWRAGNSVTRGPSLRRQYPEVSR